MNLEEQAAEMLSFDMWREEVADAVAMTQPQGEQDMVDLLNRPERHLILSTTGGILEQGSRVRQLATSFHVGAEPDGVISISMMTRATDEELERLWPGSTVCGEADTAGRT